MQEPDERSSNILRAFHLKRMPLVITNNQSKHSIVKNIWITAKKKPRDVNLMVVFRAGESK
ncbi:hypothetical protein [Candidatus Finniella inopinata]|uniref:Uncharacterized protein n=1 Tax=Candidatus Finniella inopinata TaxID=1696036 RepID=A0A4V2DZN4_9PROT|nr:hypothetical protein [Candidatus Finniella inopinata]RZI45667.1 hypothetical protein EQU50_06080 [Candidatus Finniella inopinata]